MLKVGEHITLDFLGVKKEYENSFYEKIIYKIAKAAKVEILNVSRHQFEPQGFTLVALLSESHFSFHTFPEKGVISFDFFTCGKIHPSNCPLSIERIAPLKISVEYAPETIPIAKAPVIKEFISI